MREAVGLFDDMNQLQEAVKELERTDFPRDALSVLGADQKKIEEHLQYNDIDILEDDANAPKEAPVRVEEKTIGAGVLIGASGYLGAVALALAAGAVTIPAIITATLIGGVGGAAVGAVLAKLMGDHYNAGIREQLKHGGLLLWIRTTDREKENRACEILARYGARHVRIHDV